MTVSLSQKTSIPFALAESIVPYLDEDRGLSFLSVTMLSAFFHVMEKIGRSENYDHPLFKKVVAHIALQHPWHNAYRELLEKSGLSAQEIDSKICNIFRYYLRNGGVSLKINGDLGNPTQEIQAFQLAYSNKKELLIKTLVDAKQNPSFINILYRTIPQLHSFRDFFSQDREFLLTLADFSLFFIEEILKEVLENAINRNFVLAMVKKQGQALEYIRESFKNDKDIVLAAVRNDGLALKFANPELRADEEVVLAAVSQAGSALQFASPELRANRDIVLEAVRNDGFALGRASPELRADEEVVLAAVSRTGTALGCASPELKVNRKVVLTAVRQNPLALQSTNYTLRDEFLRYGTLATESLDRVPIEGERK